MEKAAEVIRANIDSILQTWLAEARRKSSTTDIHRRLGTRKALANLSQLLDAIAAMLDSSDPAVENQVMDLVRRESSHLGELRQAQGFTLSEVLENYAVLRRGVLALFLQRFKGQEFDVFQLEERIHSIFDNALKNSAEAFHEIVKQDLLEISAIDNLTGLYNHAYFWERLGQELVRAKRYRHALSVLLIDVDDFKFYNDTYGHLAGDSALAAIGGIIRYELRASDVAARYGGEEFALILSETVATGACLAGERIREAIARHQFRDRRGRVASLTVSIGCAASEEENTSAEEWVKAADEAMFCAKTQGKNRVFAVTLKDGKWLAYSSN